MIPDFVIRGERVVTPEAVGPASIHIRNGLIVAIAKRDEVPEGCPVYDAGQSVVMPGLVDTHVHINEPGRTDWEGFETATRAAAAGGVTTLVDMPLNSIPATTTAEALRTKIEAAQGRCWVDVGFWGGVVPGNTPQLRRLFDAGVLQLFPLTSAEFTFKFDPAKPQERLKFNNLPPYVESTRAAVKYMIEAKNFKKPCIMHQDDEYGKNVLDGFTQQLEAMKVTPASITSFKRGASDFSAQVAKMKADGCDMVVLGTVIRETIGAMGEAKKLGWEVTFLGATPTNVLEVPALGKDVVEGLYAAAGFEIPYEDTAKGKVKDWLVNYKKMFGTDANTQAIVGYNAMMTFAHYANKAGKDLTGQKMLDALESGDTFQDIFSSPPTKFSKTNHLASSVTQVQQIKNGRWVLVKDNLMF